MKAKILVFSFLGLYFGFIATIIFAGRASTVQEKACEASCSQIGAVGKAYRHTLNPRHKAAICDCTHSFDQDAAGNIVKSR